MTLRKRWNDLTRTQQTGLTLLCLLQLGLQAGALWDLWRRPRRPVRGKRATWTAASFINFAGPLAYFLFGRRR